jgi:hypothetical protein
VVLFLVGVLIFCDVRPLAWAGLIATVVTLFAATTPASA